MPKMTLPYMARHLKEQNKKWNTGMDMEKLCLNIGKETTPKTSRWWIENNMNNINNNIKVPRNKFQLKKVLMYPSEITVNIQHHDLLY